MDNSKVPGGMRNPHRALGVMPGWYGTGDRILDCLSKVVDKDENARKLGEDFGSKSYEGPPNATIAAARVA